MQSYYATTLSGARLKRCYELAPPRVQQYLAAEVQFVMDRIRPGDRVLELGCGYGRVLQPLTEKAAYVLGIDTSGDSLRLARQLLPDRATCGLSQMTAANLGIRDAVFNTVVCIQNGIAVFGVEPLHLVNEAIRVTCDGGQVLLASYTAEFWEHRVEWFEIQSEHGLVGEIDHANSGDGVIVCRDGFRAGRMTTEALEAIAAACELECRITEVDGSSLVCEMSSEARQSVSRHSRDPHQDTGRGKPCT